jgi:hypothetical protein
MIRSVYIQLLRDDILTPRARRSATGRLRCPLADATFARRSRN